MSEKKDYIFVIYFVELCISIIQNVANNFKTTVYDDSCKNFEELLVK